jgi:TRAP-type uncharacterized transport system substrate-binding protein
VLGLCCLGFAALAAILAAPRVVAPELMELKVGAGPAGTRRYEVAQRLAKETARRGVLLQLETNAGTEACLEALRAGTLDAALVSSGVVVPGAPDVMVLGAVQVEAVHVLVRPELAARGSLREALVGRRVNLGERGSTEHLLARDFLQFAHLRLPTPTAPGDLTPTELGKAELLARAAAIRAASGPGRDALVGAMPDGLILLATTPSNLVQALVEAAGYRIMPLPATRAYIADNFQDADAATTVLLREYLEPTTILARSYYAERGYPEADCETVGVRLLVVARKDVPARAIRPLMEALFEGELARRVRSKSPRELATTYAIHPAAIAYLDRDKPLPVQDVIDAGKEAFSLFGALSALALSAYGLVGRKKVRRPSDYYAEIRKVEQMAHGGALDGVAPLGPADLRRHLDGRLQTLRQELIADICEGQIKGDAVIANILALLHDTRAGLLRDDAPAPAPMTAPPAATAMPHGPRTARRAA